MVSCVRNALCRGGLLGVVLLFSSGCGSDLPKFAPISGMVTQAGKPIAEAKIVLHPQEVQPTALPKPFAISDESGRFAITTLTARDGALPGKHAVTVELRAPRQAGEEMVRDGKHLLPARFADPATSGLTREVQPGENQWEPIDLPAR